VILQSLTIENFRQFYGKQTLEFARGADGRNVTLLHGFNGAGKTTLLNAFVWCLYGKTTPDFGSPERIESERAFAEAAVNGRVDVRVALHYNLRGEEFLVERSQTVQKAGESEARRLDQKLKMWKREAGELVAPAGDEFQFQQRINQMLPEGLYPFFFFNGERVEWLAKKEASQEVERGIKIFLDVEIYERSLKHLRRDVAKELSDELRNLGGDELKSALDQEALLKQAEEEAQARKSTIDTNLSSIEDSIVAIEQRQAGIAALAEFARQRDRLKEDQSRCEKDIRSVEESLARSISDDGYLAFGDAALAATAELVVAARERGELPAKLKPQFVTDLLEKRLCICSRTLDPIKDEVEVKHLCDWREKVGLAELEEFVSQTSAGIASLRQRRERCFEELERAQTRRSALFAERTSLQDRLASVLDQMGDEQHGEDAHALKVQLDGLKKKEIEQLADQRRTVDEIGDLQKKLSEIGSKIKSLRVLDVRGALIKTQKEAVEKIADVLEEIFDIQKHDVREYLSGQVAHIWNDAAIKPYTAGVFDDFSLSLTKTVNGAVQPVHGASTGEKQVLALSFVGSLVKRAKENLENKAAAAQMGLQVGGEYPLVMDSPFGSLEDDYRAKVAQWIPRLAHQVVLLVSKTQWRDEVERETRPRVGREYILELHTQKKGADRSIVIAGTEYPYVVETRDPIEQTIIREVN